MVAGARALLDDFADFLGAGPDVTPDVTPAAGLPDSPARQDEKVYIYASICIFIYIYICISISSYIYLSIYLSIYLYIYIYI